MNRTCALLILLAVAMSGGVGRGQDTNQAAAKPGGAPKLVFDKTVYDFGTTSLVSSVTGTFTFHNAGDGILEVKKPVPSCGCTVAGVKPEILKPGEKGELVFTLTIGNVATRTSVQKSISVPSNDPQTPSVSLSIKAEVSPLFEAKPMQMPMGDLRVGSTTNILVHIKRLDGKKVEFTKVDSTLPWLQPKFVAADGSDGTEGDIQIEAAPQGQTGQFNGQVRAFTDNPNQPAVAVAIYGQLIGDLNVTPQALYWGIADPERWPGPRPDLMTTRSIKVVSGKPEIALEISNLATSVKDLTLSLVPVQTGKMYQVFAKLPEAPKESVTGEITFDTNIPSQPKIKVPVTITVIKR